jgi:glutamate-1-semialdehyde aminotransferase
MVEYAKSIGKNTAEFTTKDMANFTKWWMGQPQKEEILQAIKKQQKRAGQVVKQLNTEDVKMENQEEEAVCSMELTRVDVEALLWAINEIFENYDLTGTPHDWALKSLQEGLQGVE